VVLIGFFPSGEAAEGLRCGGCIGGFGGGVLVVVSIAVISSVFFLWRSVCFVIRGF